VIFPALLAVGISAAVLAAAAASLFVPPHGHTKRPTKGWVRTDEVVGDPATGRSMRIWVDGQGRRHHRPEGAGEVTPV
jgi:hypothetical protein